MDTDVYSRKGDSRFLINFLRRSLCVRVGVIVCVFVCIRDEEEERREDLVQ